MVVKRYQRVSVFDIDEEDLNHWIRTNWMKWRSASCVLCNHRILIKLKGKVCKAVIRSIMFYDTKGWDIKQQHVHKMSSWNENVKINKWKYKERKNLKWRTTLIDRGPLLMKRWERVAWDGLVMCKGEWLMHQWGRVSWFKLKKWKKVINDISRSRKEDMSIKE